ncbi:MAG: hypothetical protein JSW60_06390 [Thermoplasmatales archaeon]|nr:MAG: hypothetical protein JSW60_06390 [Thermoplasmatales archaeon]
MIPNKIYKIGAMLGLENKDIRDLVTDISDEPDKLEVSPSPIDTYKEPCMYGTVSLKDFQ